MKYVKFFSMVAIVMAFAACNNSADYKATTDSPYDSSGKAAYNNNSSVNYTAMADSFRTNSEAGYYLDARTGKPIRIRYDVEKHQAVNEATGEPVWRYVDKRNWWVYGSDNDRWDTVGEAKMEGDKILYKGDDDTWITYGERWKDDTTAGTTDNSKVSDDGNKIKDAEGNKIKVADDGNKVKVNDTKVKAKKDGTVKDKSGN